MLDIQIAKPCDQSWTSMKGDERTRFCLGCRKNVYNIAEMTELEVEDLIQRTEGHFCARIYRRSDQRVMTADCPKGMARVRRKRALAVTAAFGAIASGFVASPVFGQGKVARVRHATPVAKPVDPSFEQGEIVPDHANKVDIRLGQIAVIPKRP